MKKAVSNRSKWVHLRLSPEEHQLVLKKRATSTCRNLSQYIRNVILDRPVVATYRNLSQDDMIRQLAILNKELNAIGNNLNQITKQLHTLRPSEEHLWDNRFSLEAETIQLKIAEVKEVLSKIAERWLR